MGGPDLAATHRLQQSLTAAGIRHEVVALGNGGLAKALAATRGRYVLSLGPHSNVAPQIVLEIWGAREQAEVVIASRLAGRASAVPLSQRLLDRFLSRWLGLPVSDLSSPVRLYDGRLLRAQSLVGDEAALASEILVRLYAEGWRVCEVGVETGDGTRRSWSDAIAHVWSFPAQWRLRNSIESADYDDRAYDSVIPLQRYWQRTRFRHVVELAGHRGPVLDVGCGSSRILSALPPGSVGLDILARKLRYARRFGRALVHASAARLPFADGVFPCVVCSQVIEHVPRETPVLEELCRVLAPGGRLVLGTPDYGRWRWRALEAIYNRVAPDAYGHEHVTRFTRRGIVDAMATRGLALEAERSILKAELILAFRKPGAAC
jgi:SAM-dependent methyltransferase